ncbi:hypothetical protein HanIR_Chr07g0315651 [Helianthus annuus]|nr:hypothetical protein HanIR_Chr07g0315651 [Helianthus annuus]
MAQPGAGRVGPSLVLRGPREDQIQALYKKASGFHFRRSFLSLLSEFLSSRDNLRVLYPLISEALPRCKYHNPWIRIRYAA